MKWHIVLANNHIMHELPLLKGASNKAVPNATRTQNGLFDVNKM